MRNKFRGTHYLAMKDFTAEEICYLVELAADLKRKWTMREPHEYLKGKTYGMIFERNRPVLVTLSMLRRRRWAPSQFICGLMKCN